MAEGLSARRNSRKFSNEYKIYTNFEVVFNGSPEKPRSGLRKKIVDRSLPPFDKLCNQNVESTDGMKQKMEVQGSHRALLYRKQGRKHVPPYSTMVINLEGSAKKVSFESEPIVEEKERKGKQKVVIALPVKSEKVATKGTQTDFRESEAQTLPWKHEIKADKKLLAELRSLDWFSLEKNCPPGVEEITLIEKALQKLAWENIIDSLRGKKNEVKRKCLVLGIAANEAALKEKKNDEENRERLELSRRNMKKAKEDFENKLWFKLRESYVCRTRENESKICNWNHQLTRKIRKMKSARNQSSIKPDIIAMHKDKSSVLYAPKVRDGENPSLGHEIIDIQCRYLKRFHGLEILEKHLLDSLQPKFLKFPQESRSPRSEKIIFCLRKFREKVLDEPKEETFERLSLKVPVPAPTPELPTPKTVEPHSDLEENLYQASLLLGKILRGRSVQVEKFLEFFKIMNQ